MSVAHFIFVSICNLNGSVRYGEHYLFTSVLATSSSANLDDVRNEWERVKLSYEILSDPKTRKKYDRNSSVAEVLKDPGAAVGRAVVGGAMNGIGLVLGGAWKLGEIATKRVYETAVAEREKRPSDKISPSPGPPVMDELGTRSDYVKIIATFEDKRFTPGTQGSVRYNNSSNPRSTPVAESPPAKDTPPGDQSPTAVNRIPMPHAIADNPASMVAIATTRGESKTDIATSSGSNVIIEKDSGEVDTNTITLLTPEPSNPRAAGAKKKRKSARKGGRGFRTIG